MITREAIYHRPKNSYAYAYDKETLHLRIQTKKGEVSKVLLRIGDPYDWAQGGGGGNLNAEGAWGWVGAQSIEMKKEATTDMFDFWIAEAKPKYKRSRYAFILESSTEQILYGEKRIVSITEENKEKELQNIGNFFCFPYLHEMDVFTSPSWVKDAVFYQIFPERFNNGNPSISPDNVEPWGSKPQYFNFMGGDLEGVIQKLDYIKDLGINAIYFCPVFESPSNHKYDTTDYKKIDPHFGSNDTFKELVAKAHERGIKIMIDAVFNHVGQSFPYWQDVLKNQENSKYKDWFCIREFPVKSFDTHSPNREEITFETFAFSPRMPKLNTNNREVRDYLIDIGTYWVKEFNVDGWRLDVANEVDHSFWREFRQAIKAINKDCYILGEIWHDSLPWLEGDQMDAVMNYTLTDAINDFFAKAETNADEFMYAVNKVQTSLPLNVNETNFNLLDSHDTKRIITLAGGSKERAKLAYLFQFSQAGAPCIYYGGEIGLDGSDDPDCRKCMPWNEKDHDLDFKAFITKLIELRKNNDAFKSTSLEWIYARNSQVIYKKQSNNEEIYFLVNNSDSNIEIELPNELKDKTVINLFKNEEFSLTNSVNLHPFDYKVIKIK